MISAQSTLRLQNALSEKHMPHFVLATEMRRYGCKLSPSDVSKIVRGIQIPNLGEKIAISTVLGKPIDYLWPKEQVYLYPDGMPEDKK
jgi:hypothetical protein